MSLVFLNWFSGFFHNFFTSDFHKTCFHIHFSLQSWVNIVFSLFKIYQIFTVIFLVVVGFCFDFSASLAIARVAFVLSQQPVPQATQLRIQRRLFRFLIYFLSITYSPTFCSFFVRFCSFRFSSSQFKPSLRPNFLKNELIASKRRPCLTSNSHF